MIQPMPALAIVQKCLRPQCLSVVGPSKITSRCLLTTTRTPNSEPASKYVPRPKLAASALSYRWDTVAPTPAQIDHAARFFQKQPPVFLWSAEKFKTMDFGKSPEICFLGRSNVGKSSLLNALLSKRIAHTSSKPGRTKLMNAFVVGGPENGDNRLVVLDMPGYGKGGRAEWGTQILKYLEKRRELKRVFLLIDAEHGIKTSDKQLLALIKEIEVPYQIVLSKADRILFPGSRKPSPEALEARISELRMSMERVKDVIQPDPEDEGGLVGEILACSSEKWVDGKRMGIDEVRFAMLQAAGLEYQPKITFPKPVKIVSHEEIFGFNNDG